jgi:hypothetical protein
LPPEHAKKHATDTSGDGDAPSTTVAVRPNLDSGTRTVAAPESNAPSPPGGAADATYAYGVVDRVFLVRWNALPPAGAIEELLRRLAEARRFVGRPLIYLTVASPLVDVAAAVRRHRDARFGERAVAYAERAHLVCEGDAARQAVLVPFVSALYRVSSLGMPVRVHGSLQEAAAEIAPLLESSPLALERRIASARLERA